MNQLLASRSRASSPCSCLSDVGSAARVNYRPVYVNEVSPGSFLVLLFTGVRWIATRTMSHPPLANGTSIDALSAYLTHDFHGFFSSYSVSFTSEAADVEILVRTATPVGLSWYEPKHSTISRQTSAVLSPPVCSLAPIVMELTTTATILAHAMRRGNANVSRDRSVVLVRCWPNANCLQSISAKRREKIISDCTWRIQFRLFPFWDYRSYRPVYTSQDGVLAYCDELGAWTFTLWDKDKKKNPEMQDPCARWTAISTFSNTFDVMSLSNWFTLGADGTQVPLSFVIFLLQFQSSRWRCFFITSCFRYTDKLGRLIDLLKSS